MDARGIDWMHGEPRVARRLARLLGHGHSIVDIHGSAGCVRARDRLMRVDRHGMIVACGIGEAERDIVLDAGTTARRARLTSGLGRMADAAEMADAHLDVEGDIVPVPVRTYTCTMLK